MGCSKGTTMKGSSCGCKKDHYVCNRELTKDCFNIEWTVPVLQTQIIYTASGYNEIYGSGYVSYDVGDVPFIVVRFLLNGLPVGTPITIFQDSSVAFNYTMFDAVEVSTPNVGAGSATGTLVITSRIPI